MNKILKKCAHREHLRAKIARTLLLCLILPFTAVSHGGWKIKAPMPTPRTELCAVTLGDYIYVIGGRGDRGQIFATVERYDPVADRWDTLVARMKRERFSAAAVAFGGKIYVMGGRSREGTLKDVEAYDPLSDRWEEIQHMREEREGLAAALLDSQIFVLGGADDRGNLYRSAERYNPDDNEWEEFENVLTTPRAALMALSIGDYMYLLGGFFGGPLSIVERYDRDLQSTYLQSLTQPRGNAAVAALSDSIFIIGGVGRHASPMSDAEMFILSEGVWKKTEAMSAARDGLAAASAFGKVYVFGGRSIMPHTKALNLVEEYAPTSTAVQPRETVNPTEFRLAQNYPNPFNGQTTIVYDLPPSGEPHPVKLRIVNTQGQTIRSLVDGSQRSGSYAVTWDGRDAGGNDAASGVYFYILQAGSINVACKLTLIR